MTLQGSLDVKAGKAPVLAMIVGAVVGVAGGEFRIINAGFHPWEMQLFPPGGHPHQWDLSFHAKVHYRYEDPVPHRVAVTLRRTSLSAVRRSLPRKRRGRS